MDQIQRLTIYEISEDELRYLEAGSPVATHLTFAIALISVAISLALALATAVFPSDRVFLVFLAVAITCSISGLFLLMLWMKHHKVGTNVADCVRNRLPPEGIIASAKDV
jgi:ABC-type sulfate transport system permease subunit